MWDPLRNKEVADTPEEKVRQWFIATLAGAGYPMGLMGSEVQLRFGQKKLRADIVVYDRSGSPAAIVECKRPEVKINASVASQALLYHASSPVRFIFLTNGESTYIYKRTEDGFKAVGSLPAYEEML